MFHRNTINKNYLCSFQLVDYLFLKLIFMLVSFFLYSYIAYFDYFSLTLFFFFKVIYLFLTDLLLSLYSDHNHTVSEAPPTAFQQ